MKNIIVIIPHYNNLEGLNKSLQSISDLTPVDVLIIDDGSKQDQKPSLKNLEVRYPNIHTIIYLDNTKNRGIEYVLNDGLKYAQEHAYTYIARLDCGDICHPDRFKLQKEFLDNHPDIYLVGSWVSFVDMQGKEIFQFRPKTNQQEIEKKMYFSNQFAHPAVMFRTKSIGKIGNYSLNKKAAEDYDYFFRFVINFSTANIPKILLIYELNPNGISSKNRKQQIKSRIYVIVDNFRHNRIQAVGGLLYNILIYMAPYNFTRLIKRILKKVKND